MELTIKCRTKDGLFSTDAVVIVETVEGQRTIETSRRNLEADNGIRATLLHEEEDGTKRVRFPGNTRETGYPWGVISGAEIVELVAG